MGFSYPAMALFFNGSQDTMRNFSKSYVIQA